MYGRVTNGLKNLILATLGTTHSDFATDLYKRLRVASEEEYAPLAEDNTNGVIWTAHKPLAVATNSVPVDASAALESSSVSKATAGRIFFITINNGAVAQYFQLHNSATVPANGAIPVYAKWIPANTSVDIPFAAFGGMYCGTGITWCNSTTHMTKMLGAADMSVFLYYV